MKKPKNQHEQVLYYLINWDYQFCLGNVISDSFFYKFTARLSELVKVHGELVSRTNKPFTNKFGNKGYHTFYRALDIAKCKKIYNQKNVMHHE